MRAVVARSSLAAALITAALVPATAGAEDSHVLTVAGTRSAFVDFVVKDEQLQFDMEAVKVTGGRTFAAVHISALDSGYSFTVGAIKATWLAPDVRAFGGTLPPGKYRARLLTDGPAKATFPLQAKGRSRLLRPSAALQVRLHRGERKLAAGRSQALLRLDDAVPGQWQAVFAYRVTGERVEQTSACVTAASRCPSLPLAPPVGTDPGAGSGFPSRETGVQTLSVHPSGATRDALVGVDGIRSVPGVLRSLILTFPR